MQIAREFGIIYGMELYEANRILRSAKAAVTADGQSFPSSVDTDGLMMLLGKLDDEKYLAPKIKHARSLNPDSAAFKRLNTQIMFFRALRVLKDGTLPGPVTAMSVMLLHKALTGDLDTDAGKLRTVDVYTDGNAHTDRKYVNGSVKSVITKMNELGCAPATSKDDFAGYLSHYMRELVILHPFERGSELTVRIFMIMFCKLKGFSLCYQRVAGSTIRAAEQTAFLSDDVAPLYKLFSECLSYNHDSEQRTAPPRTRREADKDTSRSAQPGKPQTPTDAQKQKQKKTKAEISEDEVLKRAVRLQQKISKLNEQLAELIRPLSNKSDDGDE